MKLKRFEAKGKLLKREEQEKFLAKEIHTMHWFNRGNGAEQDKFIYEKLENGYDDWSGSAHKEYLGYAKELLDLSDLNTIMTILSVTGLV